MRRRTPTEPHARIPLFPDIVVPALTAMVLTLCAYSVLCIFAPAGLDVRANVFQPPADPRPAWYIAFLAQYLRTVPPLVAALTPALLLVLLAIFPFADRNPSRDPHKRLVALTLGALIALGIIALTYLGLTS